MKPDPFALLAIVCFALAAAIVLAVMATVPHVGTTVTICNPCQLA